MKSGASATFTLPAESGEYTVGLLGARIPVPVPPAQTVQEVRLQEIERRILAIEASLKRA